MERRNFLIGMGSAAAGGSALVGSGAFSRVESQRQMTVAVAEDANAYLGLDKISGSANSENYVGTDGEGHLKIDIGKHDDYDPNNVDAEVTGEGVNSDSFTYFDDLFEICNQGKAKAFISYSLPENGPYAGTNGWEAPDSDYDEQVIAFYYVNDSDERRIIKDSEELEMALGECENIGLRTVTKGIDATSVSNLIDGTVTVTARSPDAGE